MRLAHTFGDDVYRDYQRGQVLAKRAKLMADWVRFVR